MAESMIPYALQSREVAWQIERGRHLVEEMRLRRSCRAFSNRPVERGVLENALRVAHSAPSGANRQPWRFVAIDDPAIKREIRLGAEAEERRSYDERFTQEWLEPLAPLGTTWEKPFLEVAPWLVVIFRVDWEQERERQVRNYYPVESAGLAAGFFLIACHQLGLATLTHTPSPMGFLREICGRPKNEKPYLLVPVGYPATDAQVPNLKKKSLGDVVQWNR